MCEWLLQTFSKHRQKSEDYFIGTNFGILQVDWIKNAYQVEIWSNEQPGGPVLVRPWQSLVPYSSVSNETIERLEKEIMSVPRVMDGHGIPFFRKAMMLVWVGLAILVQFWIWAVFVPSGGKKLSMKDVMALEDEHEREYARTSSAHNPVAGDGKVKVE